jgi:capsular exopolysaccharide synthesis family protein
MNEMIDREMTLRDYARVIARRKWIVAAATIATVAAALGMAALQDPIYSSSSQVLVKARTTDTIFTNTNVSGFSAGSGVPTEIAVLESELVSNRVRDDLGLDRSPPRVNGTQVGTTDVVVAVVRSGDATTSKVLADAYVNAYIAIKREQAVSGLISGGTEISKKLTEIQGQIDAIDQQIDDAPDDQQAAVEASLAQQRKVLVDQQALFKQRLDQLQVDAQLATGGAQMLREAEVPTSPVEPTPLRSALLALVVGLLLGLGAAFLLDYLDDTVKTPDEMSRASGGLSLLAVVPTDPPPDNRPIALSRPGDYAVETYRGLRTSLQFLSLDSDFRTVQFTSPMPGDGKTTTAANIATVFAQAGLHTLLIDADLRKPRLHQVFAIDPTRGLVEVLLGAPYRDAVQPVLEHLDLLPAGSIPPNPSEMLGSRQMRDLLERLSDDYDIIIVDSAPVLPVTDSVALAASVDAVVLVGQAGRSSTRQVGEALGQLQRVQAPLIGTVLNKLSGRRRGGGGYGYGYGYGYGGYGRYGNAYGGGDTTGGAGANAGTGRSRERLAADVSTPT